MEKGYNGWKNYETWCVNLWMTNDPGSYDHYIEMASEIRDAWKLANAIQEEFEESASYALPSGCFSDLLNASLGEVCWMEIAEGLLEII